MSQLTDYSGHDITHSRDVLTGRPEGRYMYVCGRPSTITKARALFDWATPYGHFITWRILEVQHHGK